MDVYTKASQRAVVDADDILEDHPISKGDSYRRNSLFGKKVFLVFGAVTSWVRVTVTESGAFCRLPRPDASSFQSLPIGENVPLASVLYLVNASVSPPRNLG